MNFAIHALILIMGAIGVPLKYTHKEDTAEITETQRVTVLDQTIALTNVLTITDHRELNTYYVRKKQDNARTLMSFILQGMSKFVISRQAM